MGPTQRSRGGRGPLGASHELRAWKQGAEPGAQLLARLERFSERLQAGEVVPAEEDVDVGKRGLGAMWRPSPALPPALGAAAVSGQGTRLPAVPKGRRLGLFIPKRGQTP